MGASYHAYAIIGARLTKQEFDKLMDTEHQQVCCGHNMVKGHKYCPYCAKEIIQETTPRYYYDVENNCLNIPNYPQLKVIGDSNDAPSVYYIGHILSVYGDGDYRQSEHFLQAKPATMLFPTVWEALSAIGYDRPQNFGLYVACHCYA